MAPFSLFTIGPVNIRTSSGFFLENEFNTDVFTAFSANFDIARIGTFLLDFFLRAVARSILHELTAAGEVFFILKTKRVIFALVPALSGPACVGALL